MMRKGQMQGEQRRPFETESVHGRIVRSGYLNTAAGGKALFLVNLSMFLQRS